MVISFSGPENFKMIPFYIMARGFNVISVWLLTKAGSDSGSDRIGSDRIGLDWDLRFWCRIIILRIAVLTMEVVRIFLPSRLCHIKKKLCLMYHQA